MLYAHFDRERNIGQDLLEHLTQSAEYMLTGNLNMLNFSGFSKEDLEAWLYLLGFFHDVGKAMKAFQKYLETKQGGREKNHAYISSAIYYTVNNKRKPLDFLGCAIIAKHHGNLSLDFEMEGENAAQLERQYADYISNISVENADHWGGIGSFSKDEYFKYLGDERYNIGNFPEEYGTSQLECFFLLQYAFSKLIWADKLDSAQVYDQSANKPHGKRVGDVDRYLREKIRLAQGETADSNEAKQVNGPGGNGTAVIKNKRDQARKEVLSKIRTMTDQEIKEKRIFTLTAPTGIGKTLLSLSAALLISERMEQIYGYEPMLITALPFINILEQAASEYEQIFDDVLVHHSGAGTDDDNDKDKETSSNKRKLTKSERLLLADAWESRVVITTFVQLFESIIGNRNSRLLKLHKLCGSIVILDEIQAIPSMYYSLIGAVIKHMSDFYGTRFILMTATQPDIVNWAGLLLETDNEKMETVELLEGYADYYRDLDRTKIVPVFDGDKGGVTSNEKLVEFICKTKKVDESALVVVNTINQSVEAYKHLQQFGFKVLYLSTNITGVDRKAVIGKAREYLKDSKPFILVSTQTVEAGVDLSFHVGYRDMAQMESLIQVAGRINRDGSLGIHRPLYVFDTGSGKKVYSISTLQWVRKTLENETLEKDYGRLVQKYYRDLLKDEGHDINYYKAINELYYENHSGNYEDTISSFRLIKEQPDKFPIIIEQNEEVTSLIDQCIQGIRAKKDDYEAKAELKTAFRKLGQYTVQVSESRIKKNRPPKFADIYDIDLGYYIVNRDQLDQYYNETGFLTDSEDGGFY